MTKPRHATACLLLLAPMALGGGSCALPAWFAAQFSPPKKVDAEFELAKGKKVLVFVDDMLNPVSVPLVKIELSRQLGKQLVAHEVAAETVSYDRLADLVAATPNFNRLTVGEVGQKVGADIVVYVQMDEFTLKDEGVEELWRGRLQTTVRVVDVVKGRLWPRDRPEGYPVPAVTTPTQADSEIRAEELTRTLAAQMADRIAKLFYEHETPHEGGWPRPAE